MPRHTHPRPKGGHTRDHVRFQRDRWIDKRWKQAKSRLAYQWSSQNRRHPEDRAEWTEGGAWPFYLADNEFSRNPFNLCSCWGCSYNYERLGRRAREDRAWRKDRIDEMP